MGVRVANPPPDEGPTRGSPRPPGMGTFPPVPPPPQRVRSPAPPPPPARLPGRTHAACNAELPALRAALYLWGLLGLILTFAETPWNSRLGFAMVTACLAALAVTARRD